MVGQYAVDRAEPADEGPTWSDVIADHPNLSGVRKRIRLYDIPRGASAERRQQITRSARSSTCRARPRSMRRRLRSNESFGGESFCDSSRQMNAEIVNRFERIAVQRSERFTETDMAIQWR